MTSSSGPRYGGGVYSLSHPYPKPPPITLVVRFAFLDVPVGDLHQLGVLLVRAVEGVAQARLEHVRLVPDDPVVDDALLAGGEFPAELAPGVVRVVVREVEAARRIDRAALLGRRGRPLRRVDHHAGHRDAAPGLGLNLLVGEVQLVPGVW